MNLSFLIWNVGIVLVLPHRSEDDRKVLVKPSAHERGAQ